MFMFMISITLVTISDIRHTKLVYTPQYKLNIQKPSLISINKAEGHTWGRLPVSLMIPHKDGTGVAE